MILPAGLERRLRVIEAALDALGVDRSEIDRIVMKDAQDAAQAREASADTKPDARGPRE